GEGGKLASLRQAPFLFPPGIKNSRRHLGQERPNRREASVNAKISLGSKPGVRLFALPLPYAAP
ncbi:hypothetical protein, partial [Ralstonia pseudosolanacearum]|uniref:hypothetical protein n=1 Tax=Ralstonia pseudosolanacearum TaxID=1310165 RepID=UPI003CFAD9AC